MKGLNATRRGVDIVSAYEAGGGTICPAGLYPFNPVFPKFICPNPIFFSYNTY